MERDTNRKGEKGEYDRERYQIFMERENRKGEKVEYDRKRFQIFQNRQYDQKQKAHMAKIVKDIEYNKERYGKKDMIVYQRECTKQEYLVPGGEKDVEELSDELEQGIYFQLNTNNDDDPSEPSSSGDSSIGGVSSSPDPSWDVAEGSEASEDDEIGDGFIAMGNLENELDIRERIGDPGSMFTPCDICGALKLNPI